MRRSPNRRPGLEPIAAILPDVARRALGAALALDDSRYCPDCGKLHPTTAPQVQIRCRACQRAAHRRRVAADLADLTAAAKGGGR